MGTVITAKAKKKLAEARHGDIALPVVAGIALGDGGVDAEGNVRDPLAEDISLRSELVRKEYSRSEKISDSCYCYRINLGKEELAGKSISEAALFDTEGDLLAISTFTGKQKDADFEMAFEMYDRF